MERIPSVSHHILGGRCSVGGSGRPHRRWGLKDWSRYPSTKQIEGRARVRDRNRGLEALTIRGVASKLHSYICRRWTYVRIGWGYMPPIPRESLDKGRGSHRTTVGRVRERRRYCRYTGNPSSHITRHTSYVRVNRWLDHPACWS